MKSERLLLLLLPEQLFPIPMSAFERRIQLQRLTPRPLRILVSFWRPVRMPRVLQEPLRYETVVDPAQETTRTKLSKTVASFAWTDGSVAVPDGARRDEDDRSWWEFDQKAEFDEENMAAEFRIEIAHSADGAPAIRNVWGVTMTLTNAPGA